MVDENVAYVLTKMYEFTNGVPGWWPSLGGNFPFCSQLEGSGDILPLVWHQNIQPLASTTAGTSLKAEPAFNYTIPPKKLSKYFMNEKSILKQC